VWKSIGESDVNISASDNFSSSIVLVIPLLVLLVLPRHH
jgi:hypothetical protein